MLNYKEEICFLEFMGIKLALLLVYVLFNWFIQDVAIIFPSEIEYFDRN